MIDFLCLNSDTICELIKDSRESFLYLAPGMQENVARCIIKKLSSIPNLDHTIILSAQEDTFRHGLGDFGIINELALKTEILHSDNIDFGILIIDRNEAYIYQPTYRVLKDEPSSGAANGIRVRGLEANNLYRLIKNTIRSMESEQEVIELDIPSVSKELTAQVSELQVCRLEAKQVSDIGQQLAVNPIHEFKNIRDLSVYQNSIQYIEIEFKNSRIKQQTIKFENEMVLQNFPPEIRNRFKTGFKLLDAYDSDSIIPYVLKLAGLKSQFCIRHIPEYGTFCQVKNKKELIAALDKLAKEVDGFKKDLEDQLKELCNKTRKSMLDNLSGAAFVYYRNLWWNESDEEIKAHVKKTISDEFDFKIREIVDGLKLSYVFKDITYENIGDTVFNRLLRQEYEDVLEGSPLMKTMQAMESKSL